MRLYGRSEARRHTRRAMAVFDRPRRSLRLLLVRVGLLCVVLTLGLPVSNALADDSQSVAPPQSIMWGAWVGSQPLDGPSIDAFQAAAGKRLSIIHFGQPWQMGKNMVPFRAADLDAVRSRGAVPLMDWGSWDFSLGTNQPKFSLSTISNGTYDAFLTEWAQAAAAWNKPFFLRFDPEMNGWWLPWSEQLNGNQPGQFVRAWQHVHDIFRAQGANNVSWVWCPNVASPRSTSIASLYPGDDYVDWTCMDGYNWGTDQGNEWQTFSQVFAGSAYNGNHNTYQEILNVAPSKPMMIGETGTSRNGGDPAAWVADALNTQLPNNFPQIQAIVWFNWNAGDTGLSWPIESSASTQHAFAAAISSNYFAANDFANMSAGPIGPFGNFAQVAPTGAVTANAGSPLDLAGAAPDQG